MANQSKSPHFHMNERGHIFFRERTESERRAKKAIGAKCGHVKRRLLRGEPLSGKVLTFALSVLPDDRPTDNGMFSEMAKKLKAGEKLNDYERHLMVDVFLLHTRLGA